MSRLAAFGTATAVAVSLAVVAGSAPAAADPIALPSLVDDGVYPYPDAAAILAAQNVRLISGDGHIVLADCATPPQGDIGLLKVWTTDEMIGTSGIGLVCFKVTAASGLLNLQVPGVYEIRGDGQRTGTGHEVTAELVSDAGEEITVQVDRDGSTPVGLGTDPDASPTMLLQLRTGTGPAPVTGAQAAVGKISHRGRMCTATLVAPRWALTAGSCFADNPAQPQLTEGAPAGASHAVFPGHAVTAIDWLSPRPGRDVVLARLATPIQDITPIALATAVVATGVDVPAVGFGRTPTAPIADQQQTAQLRFTASSATTLTVGTAPLVCSGMAGAPVLSGGKLAAVLSRAGQAGCPGVTGTDSSVTAARTDDLASWFNAITTTTADHTWTLADMPAAATSGTSVTGAADSVFSGTALPLTATTGAKWNTGDTFSPSVTVDGSTGTLVTGAPAVTTDADFTVSVRAKPTANGGTVLSQDGTNTAAFKLWSEPSDKSWRFSMSQTDVASPAWDTAFAPPNSAPLGVWSQVTVTYKASTGTVAVHVNGTKVAGTGHAVKWKATGGLRIGAHRSGSALGGFFNGRVADVRTWNRETIASGTFGFAADWFDDGAGWIPWSAMTTADVNNDGKADFVGRYNDHLYIKLSTSTGGTISFGGWIDLGHGWNTWDYIQLADITGDGKPELIGRYNGHLWYKINTSTTSSVSFAANWHDDGAGWIPWNTISAVDVNNDGKADIVGRYNDHLYIKLSTSSTNAISFGGWIDLGTGWNARDHIQLADVTGDGKPELVSRLDGHMWYKINTSTTSSVSFAANWHDDGAGWIPWNTITVADIDNDGKADFAGRYNDHLYIKLSTSSTSTVAFSNVWYDLGAGANTRDYVQYADVTGDGRLEVISRKDGHLWFRLNTSTN
ncbi:FG-GAP-like repeat-containing protein [Catellatospora sichuanensis]|uniref:FG-GAP-like repeat-containing protein n=1 Tax=Catellatospora sichuanensis TaxID=1969805 RepID=UPI001FE7EC0F|nr:FG-GAP-like repeat-containing protein [Catellatospora sichuanensis]